MNGSTIINNKSSPHQNAATITFPSSINNLPKRQITIIRNDSGYGFTLSRSILYASLNNDYQIKQVHYFSLNKLTRVRSFNTFSLYN